MDKCKYCGSLELELENKTKFSVMDAPQVALKCAKCGRWLKWCPKDERKLYIKTSSNRRYQYYWNEFDCKEIVIDTYAKTKYEGCELIVDLLNDKDEEIKQLKEELKNRPVLMGMDLSGDYIKEIERHARNVLIDEIVDRYNLNNKPIVDTFGDTNLCCVMVNANDLKKFLEQLRNKEMMKSE